MKLLTLFKKSKQIALPSDKSDPYLPTPEGIAGLLKEATISDTTDRKSWLLLCATCELQRYLILNKNFSLIFSWLSSQKEIDKILLSGMIDYLKDVRDKVDLMNEKRAVLTREISE